MNEKKINKQDLINKFETCRSRVEFWDYINSDKRIWQLWSNNKVFAPSSRDLILQKVKAREKK